MPADNDLDPVDRWLSQQVWPMSPPDGAFEQITRRARRRKMRNTAISVASAAAVVVAVAVAVPLGLSGGLGNAGPGPTSVADGPHTPSSTASQSLQGKGTEEPSPGGTSAPAVRPTATGPAATSMGPSCITTVGCVPDKFIPATVTWVSRTTGYVLGQAGTPGQCGADHNSDICTSIVVTHDAGQNWAGVNAPLTGAATGMAGVSQLRFLDGRNGWAYGPELWATHDGGGTWTRVPDRSGQNRQVTDLETVNGRAYALWAKCTTSTECFSYTLMSTPAGEDNWTPVSGALENLQAPGVQGAGTASLEFTGGINKVAPAHGYLIAPDGSLYLGSLPADGSPSTWHKASGNLPCQPSWQVEGPYGQSQQVLLAPYWAKGGTPSLAVICQAEESQGFGSAVWTSADSGAHWTERTSVGKAGVSFLGRAQSLTASSDAGLILATQSGIYRLPPGASTWQPAALTGATPPSHGFTYVGMTTDKQGVAIADPGVSSVNRYGIWMTGDGGQTWQFRAIKP